MVVKAIRGGGGILFVDMSQVLEFFSRDTIYCFPY